MTEAEIISGNDEICKILEWESNRVYVYKVPNTFPFEQEVDTGWMEWDVQAIGFNTDWNMLIGAYNRILKILSTLTKTEHELLDLPKTFVVKFAVNNVFGMGINGQLNITSCWIKIVDFCKWYNSVKMLKGQKDERSVATEVK